MSAPVFIEEVSPANSRAELRAVAMLAAGIALAWAIGIGVRRTVPVEPALASHQRSAFTELNAQEQGLYGDLRAAAEEIRALYAELGAWPEPAVLAAQAVPPFVADAGWAQRGRHAWRRLDAHSPTHVVYWGKADAGEWALVLSGDTVAVWRRASKPDGALPQAIPEMLALDSWVELVPRKAGS